MCEQLAAVCYWNIYTANMAWIHSQQLVWMTDSFSVLAWIVIENVKIKSIFKHSIIVPVPLKLTLKYYVNFPLTYGMRTQFTPICAGLCTGNKAMNWNRLSEMTWFYSFFVCFNVSLLLVLSTWELSFISVKIYGLEKVTRKQKHKQSVTAEIVPRK